MIWIIGDVHGFCKLKIYSEYIRYNYTDNDIVLQLGDLGIIWYNKNSNKELLLQEKKALEWIDKLPFKIYSIIGNHENFKRILSDEFEDTEIFGSLAKKISNNLYYLKRGNIFTIDNKSFYCLGGGRSVDKQYRNTNTKDSNCTWWPEEEPSNKELEISTNNLEKVDYKVDYLLTHEANSSIVDRLIKENNLLRLPASKTEKYLENIKSKLVYKYHFFGHYHLDIYHPKLKWSCLYNTMYTINRNGVISLEYNY
jgi:hypothetical protein